MKFELTTLGQQAMDLYNNPSPTMIDENAKLYAKAKTPQEKLEIGTIGEAALMQLMMARYLDQQPAKKRTDQKRKLLLHRLIGRTTPRQDDSQSNKMSDAQITAELKPVLEPVHGRPIQKIGAIRASRGGAVTGLLQSSAGIFQFQATPERVSIKRRDVGNLAMPGRRDSRMDRRRSGRRRPDCTNSDPCKGGCISRNYSCIEDELTPSAKRAISNVQRGLGVNRFKEAVRIGKAIQTDWDGAIDEYDRVARRKTATVGDRVMAAAQFGSVVMGIGAIAYGKLKERRDTGLVQAARIAQNRAAAVGAEVHQGPITFAVDGISEKTGKESGRQLATALAEQNALKNHKIIASRSSDFNLVGSPPASMPEKKRQVVLALAKMKQGLVDVFVRGRNEQAVDLAAQAYAYGMANPGRQINLVGHGSGGMVTRDAIDILKKMDRGQVLSNRVYVANLGTPSFGLHEPHTNEVTFTSRQDPLALMTNPINGFEVTSVQGHGLNEYTKSKKAMRDLSAFLNPTTLARPAQVQSTQQGTSPSQGNWAQQAQGQPRNTPVIKLQPASPRSQQSPSQQASQFLGQTQKEKDAQRQQQNALTIQRQKQANQAAQSTVFPASKEPLSETAAQTRQRVEAAMAAASQKSREEEQAFRARVERKRQAELAQAAQEQAERDFDEERRKRKKGLAADPFEDDYSDIDEDFWR